jgi:hypothetical protein
MTDMSCRVCIISLVRTLQFIHGFSAADRKTVVLACWTIAEVNTAVICSCLTTINPVLMKLFPKLWSEQSPTGTEETPAVDTIGHARMGRRNVTGDSELGTSPGQRWESGSQGSSTMPGSVELMALEEKKSRESR